MPIDTAPAPAPAAPAPIDAPAPVAPAPAPAPAPASSGGDDYFSIDENELASLPPEIRQTIIDPLMTKVKSQVGEKMKAREASMKPMMERAQVLDQLVKQPWFQEAYRQSIAPKAPAAPANAPAPQPGVTTEEWNMAYEKAAGGDLTMLNKLQEKNLDLLVQQKYAPIVQNVQAKQRELEMTMEMNDLFTNHADAKDLDSIRMDPADPRSPSLLEFALHYVSDKGGKSFEDAYQAASKMAGQLRAQAKQVAMGIVNEKKNSVTEVPKAPNVGDESVIYVDSPQQALRQQIQATLKNQNVTYRVKPRK